MNYTLRFYKDSDYEEVKRWYARTEEGIPVPEMFPLDSTFVLEADGLPVFCIAVYLTNCKHVCYLEGWIANPDFPKTDRKEASQRLIEGACGFARGLGYKNILTFSYRDKVKNHIPEFGFTRTLDDLSSFVKELS